MNLSTKLRYVCSKDPDVIVQWVNSLPYMIEIKGAPMVVKGKVYLFYILPNKDLAKEILGGDLDG